MRNAAVTALSRPRLVGLLLAASGLAMALAQILSLPIPAAVLLGLGACAGALSLNGLMGAADAQPQAADASQEWQHVADNVPAMIGYFDRDLRCRYCNGRYAALFGLTPERMTGLAAHELVGAESYRTVSTYLRRALSGERVTYERTVRRAGVADVIVDVILVPHHAPDGSIAGCYSMTLDITSRRRAELRRQLAEERLALALRGSGLSLWDCDVASGEVWLDPGWAAMLGHEPHETRTTTRALLDITYPEDHARVLEPVAAVLKGEADGYSEEHRVRNGAGEWIWIATTGKVVERDPNGRAVRMAGTNADVTERKQRLQRMEHLARYDALTNLPNRVTFEAQLTEAMLHGPGESPESALLYLNMDHFKAVNDTGGHAAGDEVLRQLAVLLRSAVAERAVIGRLGSDEFGVLLRRCGAADALAAAEAICDSVRGSRFVWRDKVFALTVSIGQVMLDGTQCDAPAVLRAGDAACYIAKRHGRNRVAAYRPGEANDPRAFGQFVWVPRIREALNHDGFQLYVQKIVPLGAGREDGEHVEMLLRLVEPGGQVYSPMAFIPACERFGLMLEVDRWVVAAAVAHCARRARRGDLPRLTTSINLSGASLNDEDFLPFVRKLLARYPVRGDQLCFEITETVAISNLANARTLMRELRELGCRFSLDDFGSGMSSYAYLKNLPVDFLKIDGAFIREVDRNPVDYAMVESINRIGHLMGIRTIAEFVESDAVLQALRGIGVDYAQGFAIGRPEPLPDSLGQERQTSA